MVTAEKALAAKATPLYDWQPVYAATPGRLMPVITNEFPGVLQFFRWGLTPQWASDDKMGLGMFNTLKEKIETKPAYESIYRYKRCIVPANGWFDGRRPAGSGTKKSGNKQLLYFQPPGGGILLMAGLWDVWREGLYSFSVITVPPAARMASVINHVPALLTAGAARQWLQKAAAGDDLLNLLQPVGEGVVSWHPANAQLLEQGLNDARVTQPLSPTQPPPTLF